MARLNRVPMGTTMAQKSTAATLPSSDEAGPEILDRNPLLTRLNATPRVRTMDTGPSRMLCQLPFFEDLDVLSCSRCRPSPLSPAAKKTKMRAAVSRSASWATSTRAAKARAAAPSPMVNFRLSFSSSAEASLAPRHQATIPSAKPMPAASLYPPGPPPTTTVHIHPGSTDAPSPSCAAAAT